MLVSARRHSSSTLCELPPSFTRNAHSLWPLEKSFNVALESQAPPLRQVSQRAVTSATHDARVGYVAKGLPLAHVALLHVHRDAAGASRGTPAGDAVERLPVRLRGDGRSAAWNAWQAQPDEVVGGRDASRASNDEPVTPPPCGGREQCA